MATTQTFTNTLFTDWFVAGHAGLSWSGTVGAQYYTRAPSFYERNVDGVVTSNISAAEGLGDLDVLPGWQKTQYVSTQFLKIEKTSAGSDYIVALVDTDGTTELNTTLNEGWMVEDPLGDFEEEVAAVVFFMNGTVSGVVNPIIFATRSLFDPGSGIRNGSLIGQTTVGGVTGWLFSFNNEVFRQGALTFAQTDVPWEPSNTVHVWPQPQRTNLIANPSFEGDVGDPPFGWTAGEVGGGTPIPLDTVIKGLGLFSWKVTQKQSVTAPLPGFIVCTLTTERPHTVTLGSSVLVENVGAPFDGLQRVYAFTLATVSYLVASATIVAPTVVTGTLIPLENPRRNACKIDTGSNEAIIQSNFFPNINRRACVSVYVASDVTNTLEARLGLLCWDDTFSHPSFLFGDWHLVERYPNYNRVVELLDVPDDITECQMVVHLRDPDTAVVGYLDNAAVEYADSYREYFDGDVRLGLPGDFSWVGERGQSPSVWYNNLANTEARLFTHYDAEVDLLRPGLTSEWVPTGSQVIPHWYFFKRYPPRLWTANYKYFVGDVADFPVVPLP